MLMLSTAEQKRQRPCFLLCLTICDIDTEDTEMQQKKMILTIALQMQRRSLREIMRGLSRNAKIIQGEDALLDPDFFSTLYKQRALNPDRY